MKKILLLITAIMAVYLSGCTDETDIGDDVSRSAYLGQWIVSETSVKSSTYQVNITADPGSTDGVFISNFGNLGSTSTPAGATVTGKSIVLDKDQVISGITISGSGTLSGNIINLNYTLNTGADLFTVKAVYTRK